MRKSPTGRGTTLPPEAGRDGLEDRKADLVARALLGRIVSGSYPVGSVLPREDELVVEHGASRSVIREAIKLLEVHRLVRPVRRRGTEVLDPMRSLSPEVVRAMLTPRPGLVDRRMLAGLLEIRALLDVELSCLAAARRSDDDLRALDALLAELRGLLPDPEAYAARTPSVARLLARATQNPLFEMLSAWNEIVARDLEPLFAATRPAPEPHHQALVLLVDLVRRKEVAGVRELVSAFHGWATPRLLQAADLQRSGDSFPVSTPHTARPRSPAPHGPAPHGPAPQGPRAPRPTTTKKPRKEPRS
ncbi:MAG: GntR family transcriptional regulator [Sandaracinaceae bacterium]|nr:GntR family transcriptional regulator [Sandaracinaceae bacterium]